jgi:hypothetical protein
LHLFVSRVGLPPLLNGLLPLELHGSNVSVWFGISRPVCVRAGGCGY